MKKDLWRIVGALDGWCDQVRAETMFDLVTTHKPKRIVELGVYGGRSLVAMGMAARSYGGFALGIDPWTADANIEGEPNEHRDFWNTMDIEAVYRRFIQAVVALEFTHCCRWIRARAEEVLPLFPDGSIDFFSLDGNHTEYASTRDVQLWMPKIALGGHVVMDDTNWATMQKAVSLMQEMGFTTVHDATHWRVFRR